MLATYPIHTTHPTHTTPTQEKRRGRKDGVKREKIGKGPCTTPGIPHGPGFFYTIYI